MNDETARIAALVAAEEREDCDAIGDIIERGYRSRLAARYRARLPGGMMEYSPITMAETPAESVALIVARYCPGGEPLWDRVARAAESFREIARSVRSIRPMVRCETFSTANIVQSENIGGFTIVDEPPAAEARR